MSYCTSATDNKIKLSYAYKNPVLAMQSNKQYKRPKCKIS